MHLHWPIILVQYLLSLTFFQKRYTKARPTSKVDFHRFPLLQTTTKICVKDVMRMGSISFHKWDAVDSTAHNQRDKKFQYDFYDQNFAINIIALYVQRYAVNVKVVKWSRSFSRVREPILVTITRWVFLYKYFLL